MAGICSTGPAWWPSLSAVRPREEIGPHSVTTGRPRARLSLPSRSAHELILCLRFLPTRSAPTSSSDGRHVPLTLGPTWPAGQAEEHRKTKGNRTGTEAETHGMQKNGCVVCRRAEQGNRVRAATTRSFAKGNEKLLPYRRPDSRFQVPLQVEGDAVQPLANGSTSSRSRQQTSSTPNHN